jgi:hypothetical protein
MDPPTSFKIPLLLRKRGVTQKLNPKVVERLNNSLAFRKTEDSFYNTRILDEIAPRLGMRLNPGYRMEHSVATSEMKRQFHNLSKPSNSDFFTDKAFFKRKDELVNYTEHFFKNKILYSKK